MSVEIKSGWVNALESVPSDYPSLKDKAKAYVVHTAPVYRGRPDMTEENYSVSYWDYDGQVWGNICEGDIVLHWMPFTKWWEETNA